MKSILVWRQGALGDIILSLPSIYALRAHHCNEHLHLVARSDIAEIITENRIADEVSSSERSLYADLFAEVGLSGPASEFLAKFEEVYIFARETDFVFLNNLMKAVKQCFAVKTIPSGGEKVHVSAFQCAQLKRYGIACPAMPLLGVKSPQVEHLPGKQLITVHPGSGGRRKCWPIDSYFELMKSLDSEKKFAFYFILGPAEDDELYEKINAFIAAGAIEAHLLRGEPLSHVAGLLKLSSLHIGNDSGITHLSCAVGTPTVAVFGPTDPMIWGPVGKNVRIVRAGDLCRRGPSDVCQACPDIVCLRRLEKGAVLEAVRELLVM